MDEYNTYGYMTAETPVSYTHLDVYKRQLEERAKFVTLAATSCFDDDGMYLPELDHELRHHETCRSISGRQCSITPLFSSPTSSYSGLQRCTVQPL